MTIASNEPGTVPQEQSPDLFLSGNYPDRQGLKKVRVIFRLDICLHASTNVYKIITLQILHECWVVTTTKEGKRKDEPGGPYHVT